jgi:Flp pilus assembly pilin Flp
MTAHIIALYRQLRADKRGVSSMEYGILAGAIVLAVIAATATIGGYITQAVGRIGDAIGGGGGA